MFAAAVAVAAAAVVVVVVAVAAAADAADEASHIRRVCGHWCSLTPFAIAHQQRLAVRRVQTDDASMMYPRRRNTTRKSAMCCNMDRSPIERTHRIGLVGVNADPIKLLQQPVVAYKMIASRRPLNRLEA
ncbi:unnamed protein product [Toxocara canis]|uniref:Secreted protein n=1 Tax=Toxocara canis TaxID=6265 RepID=A0A183TUT4_TOXCA|nr:unnamed protein product [Toxocara canis]